MKILIVDDNVAIQEIVKDILVEVGHIVRLASSIDEAVEKTVVFSPDVVMLDSQIDDDDGLRYVSKVKEAEPDTDIRIILIKNAAEIAPKDIPEIEECIDKPFKSTDIINAIDRLNSSETEAKAIESSKKKKKKLFSFHKKSKIAHADSVRSDDVAEFGKSYVFFESEPNSIYTFTSMFDPDKFDVLIVTSDRAKAIKERFNYDSIDIMPLAATLKAGTKDIHALGTIMRYIDDFIENNSRPVIIFDSLQLFIECNGLGMTLMLIQQILTTQSKPFTLAVSVDDTDLTDKDRGILLHNMTEYRK